MRTEVVQTFYARLFRGFVALLRALRPDRWRLVGGIVGRVGDRALRSVKPAVVTVEGHRFRLDPNDDLGLARGVDHEPLLQDLMRERISPGDVVVDGGAHIGFFTMMAAKLVGPSGRVYSFEPSPATFSLLGENVRANGYGNVTLINGALADVSARGTLHLSAENTGDHRIGGGEPGRETVEIDTHGLDDFLGADSRLDFLKLDVQGAEPLVLRGMPGLLKRNPQLVALLEFAPFVLPPGIRAEDFVDEVYARFSEVLDVDQVTMSIRPTSREELLSAYTLENEQFTNLLCSNP